MKFTYWKPVIRLRLKKLRNEDDLHYDTQEGCLFSRFSYLPNIEILI